MGRRNALLASALASIGLVAGGCGGAEQRSEVPCSLRVLWQGHIYAARELGTFGDIEFRLPKGAELGRGFRPGCPGLKSKSVRVWRINGVDPGQAITVGGSLAYVRSGTPMPEALRPKDFSAPSPLPMSAAGVSGTVQLTRGHACFAELNWGTCTSAGPVQPGELLVVQPGEMLTVSAAYSQAGGTLRVQRLGCEEPPVARAGLAAGDTRWRVDLPPGAYRVNVSAPVPQGDGVVASSDGAFGILVDKATPRGVVQAGRDRWACPPPARIEGGTPEQRELIAQVLRGLPRLELVRAQFTAPPRGAPKRYLEPGSSWLYLFLYFGQPYRIPQTVRADWQSWLLAAALVDESQRRGLRPIAGVRVTIAYGDGQQSDGPSAQVPFDGHPPAGIGREDLARMIRYAIAEDRDLRLESIGFVEPDKLAPMIVVRTSCPGAWYEHTRALSRLVGRLEGNGNRPIVEGVYVEIRDGSGRTIRAVGHILRSGGGTGWEWPQLRFGRPVVVSGAQPDPCRETWPGPVS